MAINYPPASVSRRLRHATPSSGTPPSHPPCPLGPCIEVAGFSRHPSPSMTLHRLHTAPHLRAHRHRDQWDPGNRLLTHVSPFSSLSTPPLCPPFTGMGMGAVGPSPRFIWHLGLRVSSRSQRFLPYPPPFFPRRLVPCAFRVQHYRGPPVVRRPAAHTGAGTLSRCRSAAPSPQRSFPLRASLPLTQPCCPIPSVVLAKDSRATMVMRTGYRASNRTQVVAAFTPSANFMFRIYRGLRNPYGAAPLHIAPPYVRYTLPPYPIFPPPYSLLAGFRGFFLWAWSCGWSLSLSPGTPVVLFVLPYLCLAQQSVIYNPGLLNGACS